MSKNTTSPQREPWTVSRAAAELGVHPSTVRRLIASQQLPAHRVGRRVIRVYADDVRDIVAPMSGAA